MKCVVRIGQRVVHSILIQRQYLCCGWPDLEITYRAIRVADLARDTVPAITADEAKQDDEEQDSTDAGRASYLNRPEVKDERRVIVLAVLGVFAVDKHVWAVVKANEDPGRGVHTKHQ